MPEDDHVGSRLDAAQLARLRRARRRWALSSLAGGAAFLVVISAFTPSHHLPSGVPFGVVWLMFLSVMIPWTQLSTDPSKGSTSLRRLVISADRSRIRRVSAAVRRGLPLDDDDVVIARARIGVAREQVQVCAVVMGLSTIVVLVVSIRARLSNDSFPWALVATMTVVVAAMAWRVLGLTRLMAAARQRGIVDRGQ